MDRFKFRAWLKEFNKMVEPIALRFIEAGTAIEYYNENGEKCLDSCKFYDLMQCAGERHNKDSLIYEGDIVEILANGEIRDKGVICFYRGAFQVKIGDSYTNMNAPCIMITRIIGNIYENPELLK